MSFWCSETCFTEMFFPIKDSGLQLPNSKLSLLESKPFRVLPPCLPDSKGSTSPFTMNTILGIKHVWLCLESPTLRIKAFSCLKWFYMGTCTGINWGSILGDICTSCRHPTLPEVPGVSCILIVAPWLLQILWNIPEMYFFFKSGRERVREKEGERIKVTRETNTPPRNVVWDAGWDICFLKLLI